MRRLTPEQTLDLTGSNTAEEFFIKKELIRKGPFNWRDSYDLLTAFCAQRKEPLAWELFRKKCFTVNASFFWHDVKKEGPGRQAHINKGMERFRMEYARAVWPGGMP